MKKKENFFVTFATNQYDLMQSKQIIENLFGVKLRLRDSSFEDGLLYRYRLPNESVARITLYENYMPEVDEWKDPAHKEYKIIINFLDLELDPWEQESLTKYFEYLCSGEI